MKAVTILRSSSRPQLEKYGPAIQLRDIRESLVRFQNSHGESVDLVNQIEIQESASGWNRQKWENAVDQCLQWHSDGKATMLIFPRVDRETRFLAGSFSKLLEVVRSGMVVFFAREDLLLDPKKPDSFEEYQKQALDSQAYIRVLRRNTMGGKKACAETGKIPAAFGRYNGYLGLRYDKATKEFVQVPGVELAREILLRALKGESTSQITRELQSRQERGVGGNIIQRSAVSRVLVHAQAYAGIIRWDGHEIKGKVKDPVITTEEAVTIALRLKQNKERSYGFGKRTWLSGRVFCGTCGRRYGLDTRKGCKCHGSDNRCANPKCTSPKVGFKMLSALTYGSIALALSEPESVISKSKLDYATWERHAEQVQKIMTGRIATENDLNKRRQLLSFQHERGGLKDDEYSDRLNVIEEERRNLKQLQIGDFLEPEPPSPEQVRKTYDRIATFKPLRLHIPEVLRNPRDSFANDLADQVGLQVIISAPDNPSHVFSLRVKVNLPIEPQTLPYPQPEQECGEPIAMVSITS